MDFLDTISHELRTPVTNIKLAAQMLGIRLRQPGALNADPAITQYLQILQNECDREMQLVNDLLDLPRLEIESESLVLNSIVLQNWLPQLVEGFSERIGRQQQRLELRIPFNLPPLVSDLAILERIFTELLNNACKYTPPGEQIQITAQATSAEMQISVSNSGIILPEAEQSRIFDKFYRIPNADPYKHGGTGLGLALVKRLVQLLCSTIRVESAANQTTFIVTLPLSLE
ncbi:MAG: HAMP domain-containing histidine kinase [Leptolyngbyaceae cyanobacterium RM1_406_9]|nr:HAMP domain-containing histidine kinase [Leptolyngbyaceae cyanobacterium RM1_406_9]